MALQVQTSPNAFVRGDATRGSYYRGFAYYGYRHKFSLVQSSSSPYKCMPSGSPGDLCMPHSFRCETRVFDLPHDILSPWAAGSRKAQTIDIFRTGYNCIWRSPAPTVGVSINEFRFGFEQLTHPALDAFDNNNNPFSPWTRTQEIENSYAFVIVPWANLGERLDTWGNQQNRNSSRQDIILSPGYTGYPFAPNCTPAWQNNPHKTEIQITPPVYGSMFDPVNSDRYSGPTPNSQGDLSNWWANNSTIPEYWKDETAWANWVMDSFDGKKFVDVAFEMWWPFGDLPGNQLQPDFGPSVRSLHVKIEPSHNFSIKSYENTILNNDVWEAGLPQAYGLSLLPESLLPNLYVFASELDTPMASAGLSEPMGRFKKLINLVDDNGNEHISGIFVDQLRQGYKVENDVGQYFEKWSSAINTVISGGLESTHIFSNLKTSYKTLMFPYSNLKLLDGQEDHGRLFPMHIKINFQTGDKTRVSDMLRDSKYYSQLLLQLSDGDLTDQVRTPGGGGIPVDPWQKLGSEWSFADWVDPPCDFLENYMSTGRMYDLSAHMYWHMVQMFPAHSAGMVLDRLDSDTRWETFLGRYSEELQAIRSPEYRLMMLLAGIKLGADLGEISLPTCDGGEWRSFQELLQGKTAYNETLLYKMTKINETTGEKQYIWFPNSSEIDVLSYIDTQVKPDTPYRYIIEAWQLVVGNRYEYKVSEVGGGTQPALDPYNARLCILNEPVLQIIPVPFYDSIRDYPNGIRVMPRPPVRPDVNIIPYRGISDRVLIWLNGNVGDYWEPPISILPDDQAKFDNLLTAYGRNLSGGPVLDELNFKNDSNIAEFQVFRITKKPRTYSDYKDAKPLKLVANDATATSFVDGIRPNKKYYYIFRAVDEYGYVSNPSSVYEVENEKINDDTYLHINILDMFLDPQRQISKSGRRFLQIKPAFLQTKLNSDVLDGIWSWDGSKENPVLRQRDNNNTNIELGNFVEKSIWGESSQQKKYKIRLRSKHSGKKIDFNFKFRSIGASVRTIPTAPPAQAAGSAVPLHQENSRLV